VDCYVKVFMIDMEWEKVLPQTAT